MTNGMTSPAATPADRTFAHALQGFEQARRRYDDAKAALEHAQEAQVKAIDRLPPEQWSDLAQLEAIGDRLRIGALGDELFSLLPEADGKLDALMTHPTRSHRELSVKLSALLSVSWERRDYLHFLANDAALLAGRGTPQWDAAEADCLEKRAAVLGNPGLG